MIRPYRVRAGQPLTLTRDASTCASTATIRVGNVVKFDIVTETASHRLVRASTTAGIDLSTNIAGIAAQSDTSDGSTLSANGARPLTFWAADQNTEFLFPSKIAGTASSLVGTILILGWDSTNQIHYADAGQGSSGRIYCTEVITVGDTNGWIVGRFLSTAVSPAIWPR